MGLSVQASKSNCKALLLMCGVRFMAETGQNFKSGQKRVWLCQSGNAGCPMAEQLDLDCFTRFKAKYIRIMQWLPISIRLPS